MFENKLKKVGKTFENQHILKIFFGKTALNRGLALFSAVWKLHYTKDRTN